MSQETLQQKNESLEIKAPGLIKNNELIEDIKITEIGINNAIDLIQSYKSITNKELIIDGEIFIIKE